MRHPVGSGTGGHGSGPPVARPRPRRRPGRSRAGRGLGGGCRLGAAALLAGLWLVVAGATAGAHGLLETSDPADGATLDAAPRQVLLTFTERPEPRLSSVRVLDTAGNEVSSGPAAPVAGQPRQLSAPLGEVPDGTYTVSWRIVSKDDGHVTAGTLAFGVGVPAPAAVAAEAGAPANAGEARAPSPLAVAGRWALYAGLILLVGAAATGLAVFGRALPAGARPLLGLAAALAVAGVAARLLAERAAIDASFGDLLGTSTGQGLLRLAGAVLVVAVAAAVLAARPSGWWRLGLVGAAAGGAMLLHVVAGHAAGPSSLRSLNLLAQWVHVVAVGTWIGGLVWLLAGLRGRERPQQVAAAVRFSKLAAPVLAVVAFTGLARTVDLAGGLTGLVESGYGRLLDLKVLLVLGLVALGALHHYRVVPGLRAGREPDRAAPAATTRPGLDRLRRGVRAEVVLAVGVLAATAILSQLPPGKFVVGRAAARPAPPSVQVQGNDFATSVRVGLTVSPGTAGPNAFTAKVTDYDSGEPWPAERVALRFTPRDQPDVGQATLELTHDHQHGLWRGQGSPLSIEGRWVVVALIEGSGPAVTVPLELETRPTPQQVQVSRVPGQPTLFTITLAAGGTLQTYIDPGKPGANTVHFTFFTPGGDERPASKASATMAKGSGAPEPLELLRLGPGHLAANVDLEPGRASFAIRATAGGKQAGGRFEQVIE